MVNIHKKSHYTKQRRVSKIKKGLDRNPAPFKIQYPMKNRYIDVKSVYNVVQASTYIFISLYIYGILPLEFHCRGLYAYFSFL
jgi:hypothetical protein